MLVNLLEIVKGYFVFVELAVLEIQITGTVFKYRKCILRYLSATGYSYGNGFVNKRNIQDIKDYLVFSVIEREFGKEVFSYFVLYRYLLLHLFLSFWICSFENLFCLFGQTRE